MAGVDNTREIISHAELVSEADRSRSGRFRRHERGNHAVSPDEPGRQAGYRRSRPDAGSAPARLGQGAPGRRQAAHRPAERRQGSPVTRIFRERRSTRARPGVCGPYEDRLRLKRIASGLVNARAFVTMACVRCTQGFTIVAVKSAAPSCRSAARYRGGGRPDDRARKPHGAAPPARR